MPQKMGGRKPAMPWKKGRWKQKRKPAMPRKKGGRKRKPAPDPTIQDPVTHDSADDVNGGTSGTAAELGKDLPCTFLCDLLCDIPSDTVRYCWDEETRRKVSAELTKCYGGELDNGKMFLGCDINDALIDQIEDTIWVDLRGRHIDDALDFFMRHLYCCLLSPTKDISFMNAIVGCNVHGVGKGILKQAIVDLLDRDKTIRTCTDGPVILIEVAGRTEFDKLGWVLNKSSVPQ